MFFNCLNTFWFIKIIQKLHRKLSGKEKIKEKNSLKDRWTMQTIGNWRVEASSKAKMLLQRIDWPSWLMIPFILDSR
jgi:hypothetical protein